MTFHIRASSMAVMLAGMLLAGCAGDSTDGLFTTGALSQTAAKADPACVTLASSIDGLRKEGIAEKIEKAAAKKYKMTAADLKKADQLTKANADFQARCSTVGPKSATAPGPSTATAAPKTSVGLANSQ
jgi:outer membrane murein-binding lipoprotein Lpp